VFTSFSIPFLFFFNYATTTTSFNSIYAKQHKTRWYVYNPCMILVLTFLNIEKFPMNPITKTIKTSIPIQPQPSMTPMPLEPHTVLTYHRPPRHLHTRSYSDYTHPYPTSSPPHKSGTQLAPIHHHRRSKSTNNTLDFLAPLDKPPPSEKYSCSFCQKGFSRPSSLRIHIYSHTGERPFACPEENCNRKFSVQSNMRRHLKVHKLGKKVKNNQPLAAKPYMV
jgi:hypothetical protein